MNNGLFPEEDDDSIYFPRSDPNEDMGTFSKHPFILEEKEWPSVEHYFQAMKFENVNYQEKIRAAKSPKQARKLGRSRRQKIRKDWSKIKVVIMTRAVYTKCRSYPTLSSQLLESSGNKIVENSQYDYFWGCGRDRRGENKYGQVLMNVRKKLQEEARVTSAEK